MGKFYKVAEVADLLEVSHRTVYNWIDWGYLKGIKVGEGKGTIRIPEDALIEFIQKNLTIPEPILPKRKLLKK